MSVKNCRLALKCQNSCNVQSCASSEELCNVYHESVWQRTGVVTHINQCKNSVVFLSYLDFDVTWSPQSSNLELHFKNEQIKIKYFLSKYSLFLKKQLGATSESSKNRIWLRSQRLPTLSIDVLVHRTLWTPKFLAINFFLPYPSYGGYHWWSSSQLSSLQSH